MDLFPPLKRALADQQYTTPTPIQAQTIPAAISGQDILGCAQTGTGKTAAFALPILDYIGHESPHVEPNRPTTLVLAPTRELAIQISTSFRVYGKHVKFRQALVYGGVRQHQQVKDMRRGVDVLVATPGRLIDLMDQKHIDLSNVQIFVLDEADRMLDMGFLPDLRRIIARLPKKRQSLFFSATLPKKSLELSTELLFNPISVHVSPQAPDVQTINQKVQMLERGNKFSSLQQLLALKSVERAIVFTRTKRGANQITKRLEKTGVRAAAIHGNKTQNARQRALEDFRRNKFNVLVATDVASRGIDIDGVTHVVNYDMPVDPESYIHRIGRTGRAGADGVAISFCLPDERAELRAIERLVGKRLAVEHSRNDSNPASRESKTSMQNAKPNGKRRRRNPNSNGNGKPVSQSRGRRRARPKTKLQSA